MKYAAPGIFAANTEQIPPAGQDVLVLVAPGATMADLGAITQPMHCANVLAGQPLFRWRYVSQDGKPVRLECGARLECGGTLEPAHRNSLIVLNGGAPLHTSETPLTHWIRRQYRLGNRFVLLGNAVFSMARTGLLNGRAIAVHWEWRPLFEEMFEDVDAANQLYTLDDRVCGSTCSDATIELILHMIRDQHGADLARQVQEKLNRPELRPPSTPQAIPLALRYGTRNRTFLGIVERILSSFDGDIAIQDLCREFNISRRHLERQFASRTGMSPLRFIKECRLRKAHQLLQVTNKSVLDVALACGFQSAASLRSAFKRKYGITPAEFARQS